MGHINKYSILLLIMTVILIGAGIAIITHIIAGILIGLGIGFGLALVMSMFRKK